MPFYVKYSIGGDTVVEELLDCRNRGDAVKRLDTYKDKADGHQVSLTSDMSRVAQWRVLVVLEDEISPAPGHERN